MSRARVDAGLPSLRTRPVADTPDVAVVSLWTPELREWSGVSADNKRRYCAEWRLPFYGYDHALDTGRPASWSKIPAVRAHLTAHDWLFWMDADAVFANFSFDLRRLCDPRFDLIVSHDWNGLNNGTFLIRNCSASDEFLRRTWTRDIRDRFLEQSAMEEEINEMPLLRVATIAKRSMNSYWSDYEGGDFIFHTPGEPNDIKNKLLRVVAQAAMG